MASRLLLLLTAACLLQAASAARAPICGVPSAWTVDGGRDPLAEHRGNVTLVALLKAS